MWRVFCTLALFMILLAGCVPARAGCPAGAVKWNNGHCYEAVLAPGVSWDQAQDDCVARGGHLATITSAEENAFVFSLVSGNPSFWYLDGYGNGLGPWLGGYQTSGSAGPGQGWRWVTGEPFAYTNWETDQPGDMSGLEQDRLRFFRKGGLIGDRWDDSESNNPQAHRRGYIFESDSEITGYVQDGYGHKLGGVEVTLLAVSPAGPTTQAVTITDDGGQYSFGAPPDTIQPGDYQIEMALECHEVVGDTATFSINYDTGPSVRAQTDTFQVPVATASHDISFADPSLIPAAGIPADRLDDLALMYYHTKQVVDFEWSELGVTPDLLLPIEVHAYRQGIAVAFYQGGDVTIGEGRSASNQPNRPMCREWHEMFHELMDDTVGIPPLHIGDTNHKGYANHCTGDSWVEGWAEFWPCALKRNIGSLDWRIFDWLGGNTNFDFNWTVWDREEFAVAGLLVDLVDPVEPADYDFISLTNGQLWAIIGSTSLVDMSGVYSALVASNVGQLDIDADGISDLDELFIAHGFFADDGNKQWDAGEVVGLGGKPGRTDTPAIPGTNIRILVADSLGNPITTGTLLVDVAFPSPLDIYNYSYEVPLFGSDSQVGFYVAPNGVEALMTMRVRGVGGTLSDPFVRSNSVYWEEVEESTTGYATEHTFVLAAANVAPVAADNSYSVAEDTTLNEAVPGVLGDDTDVNLDLLTATLVNPVSHGTLTLDTTGSFSYTPAAHFNGTDSFTYRASDGKADSNVATVTITVNAVNDPPVAIDDAYSVDQDNVLTVSASGVLSNDSDVDGTALTAAVVSNPSDGELALDSAGTFTYTPTAYFAGTDSFTYKATDGTSDSNVATVTITVKQAAPTITSTSPNKGFRGKTLQVTISGTNLMQATAVSFGEGIATEDFTVDSPSQITADITIAEDALTGETDVSVTTPGGSHALTGGFTVGESKEGLPFWIWIAIGLAAVFGVSIVAYLVQRKLRLRKGAR